MAELLAVAGGISSFITIAEAVLHLVQGCRQLIRDAKDAPKDVKKLVEELEILSGVAEGIERIVRKTENEELRRKVDEAVRAPLERCAGVIDGLKRILAEYEHGFQKAGAKLWWEKVKAVKGKKGVSRFLDEIERAKLALVLAHQNAASITAQSQNATLGNISQSVGLIRSDVLTTSAKINDPYIQGNEILTVARSAQQHMQDSQIRQGENFEIQKAIERKVETISESQNRAFGQMHQSLELVHDSNTSMSAKIDENFNQGETILTITKRNEETMHRLVELVTALDTHDRRQREKVEELELGSNDGVHFTNNASPSGGTSISRVKRRYRWKETSYTQYLGNRYLCIESTTTEETQDEEDSTQELGVPKRTETTFTIRSTLPFLKRALYYSTSGTAWDPLYERKLRYTWVFTDESAIWKACKACNLDEISRLFISGEASPFMEDEWGWSLVDNLIEDIADKDNITDDHVQLVHYLVKNCGRGGTLVRSYTVWYILWKSRHNRHVDRQRNTSSKENSAEILRLVVEYSREDPLDNPSISSLIDLDNSQDVVVTALIQQPFWPLNTRPVIQYGGTADEIRYAFYGLFEIATRSTTGNGKDVLRQCCKNRMKLLISTSSYHRFLNAETLDFGDVARIRWKYPWTYPHQNVYVGGYAIRHGHRALLEEVFHELEWSDFDIDDFFDKEIFDCVPDLLDGEINYVTLQQMQQEFILSLCDGAFTEFSGEEIELLSRQLSYPMGETVWFRFVSVIKAANIAFMSKSTPGSWPEEGEIKLVPGVDFVVNRRCEECIFSWYRDYVDPNFEFDLSE